MITAKSVVPSSTGALETEVENVLNLIEVQIIVACHRKRDTIVTHAILQHPSYLVRQEAFKRIMSLGYSIVRETGEEGYQWHTISWGAPEKSEDKPWWKIWE